MLRVLRVFQVCMANIILETVRLLCTSVLNTPLPAWPAPTCHAQTHPHPCRTLATAAISTSSALVGKTLGQLRFRQKYDAAVVGVHREGTRFPISPSDMVIQVGGWGCCPACCKGGGGVLGCGTESGLSCMVTARVAGRC